MFGYSISSLTKQFIRTAAAIEKQFNVTVTKMVTTKGTRYFVQELSKDLSIFTTKNKIYIVEDSLKFETFEFLVFLTVVAATEFGVYRGTIENLLEFIEVKKTKKNIQQAAAAIQSLVNKGYIQETKDGDYEILFIKRDFEKKISINVEMLQECRKIVIDNNKQFKKISQFIQVWEAIRICEEHQPFTYAELKQLTGLSYKQIRDIKKLLESNNVFISNRVGSYWKCLGMEVDLNGFYDINRTKIDKK